MKSNIGAILHEEQERYVESLLPVRDPVAAAVEAAAGGERRVPIVDPEVGRFLYAVARGAASRRILEVGTATGYSGLWLARALPPDGRLVTIDVDPDRQAAARQSWTAAGVADRVELICRPALEAIPMLDGPFDLLFIDALKDEYRGYLDLALPLMRPGALVLVDNVLWGGRVARGEHDKDTDALREFNAYALAHPRLTGVILPLGDGVLYAVVEE
ncbi:MAG TPA: O-methyltransferase [Chloroflexia bacterium]|nr:O-methyltransferase [Chloroflexia bacterium]